jgi:hypothetical protein
VEIPPLRRRRLQVSGEIPDACSLIPDAFTHPEFTLPEKPT